MTITDASTLSREELAGMIQFTLVRPDATRDEIIHHVELCAKYTFNAAMIPMCWVELTREILKGTGVRTATAISFGLGNETVAGKAALIQECRSLGADEVDYQPNMGFYLSGMYDEFRDESVELLKVAGDMVLKPMFEMGYLKNEDEQKHAAKLLDEAGVPWIKNSSGTGPHRAPATPENIRLLRETVSERCRVKASGGIKGYRQSLALIEAGAELLGTSKGVEIIYGLEAAESAY